MGAWQAGALAGALTRARDTRYVCVAGTSIGAANAAFLAQWPSAQSSEAVAALCDRWQNTRRELPGRLHILCNLLCCGPCAGSALDGSWLRRISKWIDFQRVLESDVLLAVGCVNAETQECEYHTNGPRCQRPACKGRHTAEELRSFVEASMAVPALFPSMRWKDREYIDGGVRHIVPRVAFPNTLPTDVVLVDPERRQQLSLGSRKNLLMRLYSTISVLASSVAEADLQWLQNAYGPRLRVLRPSFQTPYFSILSYNDSSGPHLVRLGYDQQSVQEEDSEVGSTRGAGKKSGRLLL